MRPSHKTVIWISPDSHHSHDQTEQEVEGDPCNPLACARRNHLHSAVASAAAANRPAVVASAVAFAVAASVAATRLAKGSGSDRPALLL